LCDCGAESEYVGGWRSAALEVGGKGKIIANLKDIGRRDEKAQRSKLKAERGNRRT
jgi:hypothetical protein